MKEALLPQLMAISNLQDVIDNDAVPNEAASTILAIEAMDAEDIAAVIAGGAAAATESSAMAHAIGGILRRLDSRP